MKGGDGLYTGIDSLNSAALEWLDRECNGTIHEHTRKAPRELFREESKHLEKVQTEDVEVAIRAVSDKNAVICGWSKYELPQREFDSSRLKPGIAWKVEQLESLQWIEEEQNIVVIGKCDTGKTTLVAHIGQLALDRREAVYYCNLEIENNALLRAEYMGQTRSQRFSGKSSFSVTFRLLGKGSQNSRPILPDNGAELALEPENKATMERIDEETIQLQEAALALHKVKQRMEIEAVEYASRVKEYSERMKELEAERNELQGTAAKYAEVRMWLDTFIEQTMQSDTLTTVDGTTMKMLVDRIHVMNDGIVVEFKCGVAIEQEYVK